MTKIYKADNLLSKKVTEDLTVNVIPSREYEFLMTTKEVAKGYGVSDWVIRQALCRHSDELLKGKHFSTAVTFRHSELPGALKCAHNAILWTKRGIVRLGFFIKSPRAKLFRDWAEELVLRVEERRDLFGAVPVPAHIAAKPVSGRKTRANRLTPERMASILADVCRIDNDELRHRIVEKLTEGGAR